MNDKFWKSRLANLSKIQPVLNAGILDFSRRYESSDFSIKNSLLGIYIYGLNTHPQSIKLLDGYPDFCNMLS